MAYYYDGKTSKKILAVVVTKAAEPEATSESGTEDGSATEEGAKQNG